MRNIFSYEGKLNTALGKIADCVLLNILWFVFSVPVITIGASTAAAYHAADKVILRGESFLWREYWKSFKQEFRQATVVWLLTAVVEIVTFLNYRIMYFQYKQGMTEIKYYLGFMVIMAFVFIWALSAFAYMTKFNNTIKQVIRNSLYIFSRSLPNTVGVVAVIAAAAFLVLLIRRTIFIVPSVMLVGIAYFMNKIYAVCLAATEE